MAETVFARPTRQHAIEFALAAFVRGDRVDMQTLAGELGVGRTTLYRWVGDRERLLGEVLAILTRDLWDRIAAEPREPGLEGGLAAIRRFMEITASYPPLRRFAESEPGSALRVLLAADGAVASALREGSTRVMLQALDEPVEPDPRVTDILVQLGTALEWAPIVAGETPAIDRAIELMRTVLVAHYAPQTRSRRLARRRTRAGSEATTGSEHHRRAD